MLGDGAYLTLLSAHLTTASDQLTDSGVHRTDLGDYPTFTSVDNRDICRPTVGSYGYVMIWVVLP